MSVAVEIDDRRLQHAQCCARKERRREREKGISYEQFMRWQQATVRRIERIVRKLIRQVQENARKGISVPAEGVFVLKDTDFTYDPHREYIRSVISSVLLMVEREDPEYGVIVKGGWDQFQFIAIPTT